MWLLLHMPLRFNPFYLVNDVEVFVVTYDCGYFIFDGCGGVYGVSWLQPIFFCNFLRLKNGCPLDDQNWKALEIFFPVPRINQLRKAF
jgi:hypothetical protein